MRNGPRDFRIGDVMHFQLEELETPFGDVGLRYEDLLHSALAHPSPSPPLSPTLVILRSVNEGLR